MSYIKAPKPREQKYYDFLERLRQSGATNMFGASVYLAEAYHMNKQRAVAILADWMQGHDDPERVIKATGPQKAKMRRRSSHDQPARSLDQKVSSEASEVGAKSVRGENS